ncbi:hypothetical protein [Peribacillus butanolivorans]|uniref:hypothetical protein n=1 Tax=Peribacillus butanolivorans TaxID=421767 RepID=UPI001CBE9F6C|nr:hypothetical protein [Peribacillus butanolivorans]
MSIYGNEYDHGDTAMDYLKFDNLGKIHKKHNRFYSQEVNTVLPTTPPSFFAENSMNITYHNGATTSTGFPAGGSNVGTLISECGLSDFTVQKWYPNKTSNVRYIYYIRTNVGTE